MGCPTSPFGSEPEIADSGGCASGVSWLSAWSSELFIGVGVCRLPSEGDDLTDRSGSGAGRGVLALLRARAAALFHRTESSYSGGVTGSDDAYDPAKAGVEEECAPDRDVEEGTDDTSVTSEGGCSSSCEQQGSSPAAGRSSPSSPVGRCCGSSSCLSVGAAVLMLLLGGDGTAMPSDSNEGSCRLLFRPFWRGKKFIVAAAGATSLGRRQPYEALRLVRLKDGDGESARALRL